MKDVSAAEGEPWGLWSVIKFLSSNINCLLEFINTKGIHVLVEFSLLKLKLLDVYVDS